MWKTRPFRPLAPGAGFAILVSGSVRGGFADDSLEGN
jgi:hypothetical protein